MAAGWLTPPQLSALQRLADGGGLPSDTVKASTRWKLCREKWAVVAWERQSSVSVPRPVLKITELGLARLAWESGKK